MAAQPNPENDSLLAAPLARLSRWTLRYPRSVLAVALVLAVAAMLLTATRLEFRTSRLDLISRDSDYNRLWLAHLQEFGETDDTVIVVQGPRRAAVVAALDELAGLLHQESDLFNAVLHRVDLSPIRAKGLYYLSLPELQEIETSLSQVEPVLGGDWSLLRVDQQLASVAAGVAAPSRYARAAPPTAADMAHLQRLGESLAAAFAAQGRYVSCWPDGCQRLNNTDQGDTEYLLANDGRLGFILLRLAKDERSFTQNETALARLRELIAQMQPRHVGVKIGLTGLPVMEHDEMHASQRDMLNATLLSMAGVVLVYVAGLGGLRHSLLACAVFTLAMAWTFGYATLAVGHLNILSVAFGVMLIGLGVDFCIHFVARYLKLRGEGVATEPALVRSARIIGPGVVTSAITGAAAFFATCFTDFTGVVELGVIAGGGMLLCLVGAIFVLPPTIQLADRYAPQAVLPRPLDLGRLLLPLTRYPRTALAVSVLATCVAAIGLARLKYDHNLLNLQPAGLESVELERMLLTQTEQSVWFAMSTTASPEELLRRKEQFEKLPSVDRTEEIVSILPADVAAKEQIIARIGARLASAPQQAPTIPVARPADLASALAAVEAMLPADSQQQAVALRKAFGQARENMKHLSQREIYQRLASFQQQAAEELVGQLQTLKAVGNPSPPALADLPPALVTRFVGQQGRHLLKIYGRGDIWDMAGLAQFVAEVKGVDPAATGQPLQTYYASRQMQRSYLTAALYALVAVTILLMLDFRDLGLALLALLPVAMGTLQLFGLMGVMGAPLNPANMIVLPLILGIGVDYGVHIVHDFRQQRGRYTLDASLATAMVITALTTTVSFGALMIASHRGLASLGRVMTLGVTFCLLSSLLTLPAVLSWLSRHRPPIDGESSEPASDLMDPATEPRRAAA